VNDEEVYESKEEEEDVYDMIKTEMVEKGLSEI
jgi:hypothetical protein